MLRKLWLKLFGIKKWKYRQTYSKFRIDIYDVIGIDDDLKEMGEEGWELISILQQKEKDEIIIRMFFKRPL